MLSLGSSTPSSEEKRRDIQAWAREIDDSPGAGTKRKSHADDSDGGAEAGNGRINDAVVANKRRRVDEVATTRKGIPKGRPNCLR